MTCDYPLRHGYTFNDVHRLARIVAATTHTGASIGDRYDEAFSAIAEHLYTVDEHPDDRELVHAGRDVVLTSMRHALRHHGYAVPGERAEGGVGARPRFIAYWEWVARVTPGPEGRVVDEAAVRQILPLLAPKEAITVHALAAFGSYQLAAEHSGMTYQQFCNNLRRARAKFLVWWHEGEVPSKVWTSDRRDGGDVAFDGRRVMKRFRERQRYAAGRS